MPPPPLPENVPDMPPPPLPENILVDNFLHPSIAISKIPVTSNLAVLPEIDDIENSKFTIVNQESAPTSNGQFKVVNVKEMQKAIYTKCFSGSKRDLAPLIPAGAKLPFGKTGTLTARSGFPIRFIIYEGNEPYSSKCEPIRILELDREGREGKQKFNYTLREDKNGIIDLEFNWEPGKEKMKIKENKAVSRAMYTRNGAVPATRRQADIPDMPPPPLPENIPDMPPPPLPENVPDMPPPPLPENVPDMPPPPLPENNPDMPPPPLPENNPDMPPPPLPENIPDMPPPPLPENNPDMPPPPLPENNPDMPPPPLPENIPANPAPSILLPSVPTVKPFMERDLPVPYYRTDQEYREAISEKCEQIKNQIKSNATLKSRFFSRIKTIERKSPQSTIESLMALFRELCSIEKEVMAEREAIPECELYIYYKQHISTSKNH